MTSQQILHAERKENKQCTRCGWTDERTLAGRVLCKKCYSKMETLRRRREYKRSNQGLCIKCGKPTIDFLKCPECREKQRFWNQNYLQKRKNVI